MTSTIVKPKWLLDTNILSRVIKYPHDLLGQRLRDLFDQQPGALVTSMIVECELMFGAARVESTVLPRKITDLLQFIPVVALAQNVVPHYATIRAHLQRQGTPIGPNDTLIAAHALALDCTLVTDNETEFRRVPGLRVENWLAGISV
ncbi:type II toxin-antitoxin system VapC family toxin [Rhodoferax ferrireducens]|uniref:type II toxin-antitoxin system VapC family toxin n=1 Tax=Rhodoferax ferrireducens TaxID=192843 RepID=UPI000E0DBF73|nr:type II toxin-antitoxin system VapC family toxin [Rhodoferax ferrireducens]